MSYNFPSRKPNQTALPADKKIDMQGLDMSPIALSLEKEQAAIAKGEQLGYVAREAIPPGPPNLAPEASSVRRRKKVPTKAILVTGPVSVIDKFIEYANESGATSYWQAIENLLALQRAR